MVVATEVAEAATNKTSTAAVTIKVVTVEAVITKAAIISNNKMATKADIISSTQITEAAIMVATISSILKGKKSAFITTLRLLALTNKGIPVMSQPNSMLNMLSQVISVPSLRLLLYSSASKQIQSW